MHAAGHNDVAKFEGGVLLLGVGAVLLFVSLFLEWYQRGTDAFEAFEVWDLVLAILAAGVLVAVASRFGFGPPRPASWLIGPTIAALVIVLFALLNPPPVAAAIDDDPSTGLWLALAATILMSLGALLSVARVSVAFTHGVAPVAPGPGIAHDPAQRGPFAPRAGVTDPVGAADPVAPVHPADPAAPPVGTARGSRRFMRGTEPPASGPVEPAPPTEPTRRI